MIRSAIDAGAVQPADSLCSIPEENQRRGLKGRNKSA
jgi:hypothetical protein